jgi:Winged helix DNA-binding domain
MGVDVLDRRALNRATLQRQLLLQRSPIAPFAAVIQLVGLQAQNPRDPYLALWSRLDRFDPLEVGALVQDRALVRIVVMRGTIHLVTGEDALQLRPLMQPVLDAEIARHSEFAQHLVGVDLAPVVAAARALMAERPMTGPQLRTALAQRFADVHPAAAAYACRCKLPLVQVPPRGVWGRTGQVTLSPLDAWVGMPMDPRPSIDDVVLRYFAAFGPATVADVAAWSRLTGLREVVERIGPKLRVFRDERGRELFDLPDAPRPDPGVAAPVRFLPEYDNVLLSHADRSRFGAGDPQRFAAAVGPYRGAVLVDGEVQAIWHSEHDKATKRSTVVVEHLALGRQDLDAVAAEGTEVARFWHPDAIDPDVQLRPIVAS